MNRKIWSDSEEFKRFEKEVKINNFDAFILYDSKFNENFKDENLDIYIKYFDKIIYLQNQKYYIGYISKMDKNGIYTNDIYCLIQLDPKTVEIIVVK